MQPRRSQKGFTLIEVIIVLVILIIMGTFLFGTFNILLGDYISMHEESKIHQDAFNALDQISYDIKGALRSSLSLLFEFPAGSGNYSALSFQADLDNDNVFENYIYYLYHPSDSTLDASFITPPMDEKFYRLYRYQGDQSSLTTNYAGHPGVLLADEVAPPDYDGTTGTYFQNNSGLVTIRLRLEKEKESVIKEKIVTVTSVYARN